MAEANVILVECPADKKMGVIKVLRIIDPALSLPDAKTKAETANITVKEAVYKNEAEKLKKDLEEVGAIVKLQFIQPTNYDVYLEKLEHSTYNVIPEKITFLKGKIKLLRADIEKQKRENYWLSADIEKQKQENNRLSVDTEKLENDKQFATTDFMIDQEDIW